MNDRIMEPPDRLTAAARAELDAIQSQLKATWDTEAGLREILLEEHYHQFVGANAGGLDVEAGLAEVLGDAAEAADLEELARVESLRVEMRRLTDVLDAARLELEALARPNTVDRVRRLAQKVMETLEVLAESIHAGIELLTEQQVAELTTADSEAVLCVAELDRLSGQLERGTVGLERALRVVRDTALALMKVYDVLGTLWDPQRRRTGHPLAEHVLNLAVDVNHLEVPIKRLFEPSDDVVDALL
ncbi:hypothetical protein [Micromonospora noduli]|uniref:hypothetical protein n=1 Tax=Micromonospora noduli TaxID=709876 RepID=UPI0011BE31BA|nr:hypothetical protein [Micromonospora noduli]